MNTILKSPPTQSPEARAQTTVPPRTDRLVDADGLLRELFDADCRPSERWLRRLRAQRIIPYRPIGRLIFYDPAAVREALATRCAVRARA